MATLLEVRSVCHGSFGVAFLVIGDCSNAFLSRLLSLLAFLRRVLWSLNYSQTSYVTKAGLELLILLSPSSKHWITIVCHHSWPSVHVFKCTIQVLLSGTKYFK